MPLGAARLTLLAFQATEVAVSADVIRKKRGVTANGSIQIDTAQKVFGGSSCLSTGSADSLLFDGSVIPTASDANFTIESYVRFTGTSSRRMLYSQYTTGVGRTSMEIDTDEKVKFFCARQSSFQEADRIISDSALSINTWYHIAVVREGTTFTMYIDGVAQADTITTHSAGVQDVDFEIFGDDFGSHTDDVHQDEFRISNTARYTGNFSKPRLPFGNDANTLLLLHFDGTDGINFFEDDNGEFGRHPVQVNVVGGNTQIDTAQSQFGGASALFDGTDDYIDLNFRSDILTNTETIEFWYRPTSVSGVYGIMSQNTQSSGTGFQILQINGEISVYQAATAGTTLSGGSLSANTWHHIAVVNNAGSAALYIDGTSVDTDGSWSGTNTNTDLRIGEGKGISSSLWNTTRYDLNGHLDELRISDSARYTAGFTVSSESFTNDENTRLLMHFDGTDTSTHFPDDFGTRPATGVQANGNAQIDTSEYKFGGSSALFDGTGDYLAIAATQDGYDNPVMGLTGDYTIECFVNFDNVSSGTHGIIGGDDTSPYHSLQQASGTVSWQTPYLTQSGLTTGTWYHIAVSREGSTVRLFVDGALSGSGTNSDEIFPGPFSNYNVFIGRDAFSGYFDGHIDEVRISNVCRYTTAFEAPNTQLVNDSNTLLLLHMDGTDTSTVFRDDNGTLGRGRQIGAKAVNDAQISTAQSKFGGASAVFDGVNDIIALGNDSDSNYVLVPRTGEFTWELWIRFDNVDTGQIFLATSIYGAYGDANPTGRSWMGLLYGKPTFTINGGPTISDTTNATADTWYHFAASRDSSNDVRFFLDGTLIGTSNSSATIAAGYVALGGTGNAYTLDFDGYIDELRISNTCRYTASFTPQTEPFVNDANTLALFHFDGANASTEFLDDCGRQQVGINSINSSALSTTQSQFGGTSAYFDDTNDYLNLPVSVGNFSGDFTIEFWIYTADTLGEMIACQKTSTAQGWTLITRSLGRLVWTSTTDGSTASALVSSNSAYSDNTWTHIAVCHTNSTGTTELFANGTRVGTRTEQNPITVDSGGYFRIGGNIYGISSGVYSDGPRYYGGYIDELRISKSVRYSGASYTVPTETFQNDSNTLLLMHMDGANGQTDFTDDNGKKST